MSDFKTFLIDSPLSGDVKIFNHNFNNNDSCLSNKKRINKKTINKNNFLSKEINSFIIHSESKIISNLNSKFMCNNTNFKTYIIEEIEKNTCNIETFDIDYNNINLTYIGYGEPSACKILRINTSGCTYTSLWANGNEELNKNWDDRETYQYF